METGYQPDLLLVDDSPENIRALERILPRDWHFSSAQSGTGALAYLAKAEKLPDMILLDVMMPEMDGFEVCKKLKADSRLQDIPVIFISAASEVQSKVKALSNGGVDYITKPFNNKEIRARVSTHLKQHYLQNELERSNQTLEELVKVKIREISDLQMEMIYALTNLVSIRSEASPGHQKRLQIFCRLLAEKLRDYPKYGKTIDGRFVEQIYQASALHDIGKVALPDNMLNNSKRLSPEEEELMKTHTVMGAEALQDVQKKYPSNEFLNMTIHIALSHHEKWDGSGFPGGLSGDQIPLAAQIVSITNTYDKLRSSKPYMAACTSEEAKERIAQARGTFFDPILTNAFLEIESLCSLHYEDKQ